MSSKTTCRIAGILLALFVLIQAVRPERTNPPVKAGNTLQARYQLPAAIEQVFNRACADCHSNRTRWPWYSHVAPASWLLASHVKDGRRHMNFDDFAEDISLKDICQELRIGAMPMKGYLLLHPDAKLTGAEIQAVCAWTQSAQEK
ncbi:MAG: heme-binding domain-containing protein [Acidobacteria bacterium]|nr:heme-binding domain-containing protein [Acidobacteriota bacterium]